MPDLGHLAIDPNRPLLLVDVDEVLALFMEGFGRFLDRRGFEMRVDRFALFQNIYRPGETQHLDIAEGRAMFDEFFTLGCLEMAPHDGGAQALEALADRASVVILTNAPECGREGRVRWLETHGMAYPMVLNAGAKGPVIAELAAMTAGPVAFVDDLLPNLMSAQVSAPHVRRFQMVADERLRPLAPSDPDNHPRIDHWPRMKQALEAALFG